MSIDATSYPLHNSSMQQKSDMAKIDHFKSKKLNVHVGVHQSKNFPLLITIYWDPVFRDQQLDDHDQRKTRPWPHREMQKSGHFCNLRSKKIMTRMHVKYT